LIITLGYGILDLIVEVLRLELRRFSRKHVLTGGLRMIIMNPLDRLPRRQDSIYNPHYGEVA